MNKDRLKYRLKKQLAGQPESKAQANRAIFGEKCKLFLLKLGKRLVWKAQQLNKRRVSFKHWFWNHLFAQFEAIDRFLDQVLALTVKLMTATTNLTSTIGRELVSLSWQGLCFVFKQVDQVLQALRSQTVKLGAYLQEFSLKKYRQAKRKARLFVYAAQEGHLSLYFLVKLAINNLAYSKSRTIITTGAIALGTGAIVFLVSFAYGLQDIVTRRLIFPNATRIADVQSSSTALALNQDSVKDIEDIGGVKNVAPAINAAGTLEYNQSKTDVVVIGAQNEFLKYSNLIPVTGENFSQEANQRFAMYQQKVEELQGLIADAGDVLGVSQQAEVSPGDLVADKTLRFRVKDDTYLPVRAQPSTEAQILGYVRGSIVKNYEAKEVWGDIYESTGTAGRAFQDNDGSWYGKWLKAEVPLYEEPASTVYRPKTDQDGSQLEQVGFIPETETHILSPEEVIVEKQLEIVKQEQEGDVLGEATGSAQLASEEVEATGSAEIMDSAEAEATDSADTQDLDLSSMAQVTNNKSSTDAAALNNLVKDQQKSDRADEQLKTKLAMVEVSKNGGKEILVSTGLLDIWELKQDEIIGQNVNLEYILSGGIISNLSGKVKSSPVNYQIVGVIEDKRSIVVAPLGDIESMGADRFSTLKVLGKSEQMLENIRTHIETLGFTTQSLVDTLSQVNKLFKVMRFLLGLFGLIALIVAVFGMFNTLTVSLLERTREIGVMKTLGTTDADVLRLFMTESFLIGLLGGAFGITVGVGTGRMVNLGFNLLTKGVAVNLFKTPIVFLIFIFVLSLLVGVVTGLYPSKRAEKMKALDALRYE